MSGRIDWRDKWRRERERKAFLALADGTVFRGVAFGAPRDTVGEVVFNTGMCGYQEILTDPSYAGEMVALTVAEAGNYGTNPEDVESRGLFLNALIVNDLSEPSNFRATESLDSYLKDNGIPGIYGVDVRRLAEHLRDHGSQKAYLHVEEEFEGVPDEAGAIQAARRWIGLDGQDYAARVSVKSAYVFNPGSAAKTSIYCYDFGVKTNILRSLAAWAKVTVVPARTPAASVLAMDPDGVFLSNGPADPAALDYAIANIRELLGRVPLMGICLGHQLLSLACGAKTMRLKFGHHGCNHPVKNLATGRVEITSQNHNFAVDPATLPDSLEVTHVNLNDGTIEGVRHRTLPAFSVQYHPESCPGPHDSQYLFTAFKELVAK